MKLGQQLQKQNDQLEPLSQNEELANRAIDSMEQNHPQYLADLLQSNSLEKVLQQKVSWYKNLMTKLQLSGNDQESLDELASPMLGSVNPNWEDETPLTKVQSQQLATFRQQHQI